MLLKTLFEGRHGYKEVLDRREKWVDHRGAGLGMGLALLGIPPQNEVQCCTKEALYILLRRVDVTMFYSPLLALPIRGSQL